MSPSVFIVVGDLFISSLKYQSSTLLSAVFVFQKEWTQWAVLCDSQFPNVFLIKVCKEGLSVLKDISRFFCLNNIYKTFKKFFLVY